MADDLDTSVALVGVVGDIALSLGGYPALSLCAPIVPLVGATIIWWSHPRAAV